MTVSLVVQQEYELTNVLWNYDRTFCEIIYPKRTLRVSRGEIKQKSRSSRRCWAREWHACQELQLRKFGYQKYSNVARRPVRCLHDDKPKNREQARLPKSLGILDLLNLMHS